MGSAQANETSICSKMPKYSRGTRSLSQKGGRMYLIAEGPVYVGGQRIHSTRALENGSIIQIGRYSFRYQERLRG